MVRMIFRRSIQALSGKSSRDGESVFRWANMVRDGRISCQKFNFESKGSIQAKSAQAELVIRKTKDKIPWPFLLSGCKHNDAFGKDTLMIRPNTENGTSQAISLLRRNAGCVVLLGLPGVVSLISFK
jgi:hypothetical protein